MAGALRFRRAAGLFFFIASLLLTTPLPACDMSAFVQSEFGERCQLLLDLCDKTHLARNLVLPDSENYSGALSREWVRFYLAHGDYRNVPPSLTFIASSTWHHAMNEIGNSVVSLIKSSIATSHFNRLRLRILLLKEPQRIEALQQLFAARRRLPGWQEDTEAMQAWLEQNLLTPASTLFEEMSEVPELQQRLNYEIEAHLGSFDRILQHRRKGSDPEIINSLFNSLQQEIDSDLSFWQQLFYCTT